MKKTLFISTVSDRHSLPSVGKSRIRHFGIALLLAALLSHSNAWAVGFRLPNQDPEAIARGNAFVATADNPAAIYYNPAGITQLEGQTLSLGLYSISTGAKTETAAGNAETKQRFQEVPQFYYVFTPKTCPVSFGLGVYAPYGLGIDYGQTGPFQNVAKNGRLLYATIDPVIAWKITPELSIAAGPTINYSKAELNQGIAFPGDNLHFVGDDYDFGFTAGALWQPIKQLAFGAKYHSMTTLNYQGHSTVSGFPAPVNGSMPANASINFPQNFAVGVSYRPTENWNLEFDADWTDWDRLKQVTLNGTPFGSIILPFNYKSSWMYEFGATRQLGKGYFVSAGYIYSENSSPDANFSPLIPDSNLHLGSIGFGHHGQRWAWAFSYTLAVNPSRQVSGSSYNTPAPGHAVDGTYRTVNTAFNASVTVKF